MTGIILAGVGGQGILLAAKIIASAAEAAGLEVSSNEIHGMAQRGGSVVAQVKFGPGVRSPLIAEGTADALVALEHIEALRCAHFLKHDGFAAVAKQSVIPVTVSGGQARYPDDVEARLHRVFPNLVYRDCAAPAEQLGDPRLSNTILMGILSRALSLDESLWRAGLAKCVKPQYLEKNIQAFNIGRNL